VIRGLILDIELGNIVKANRFGYVKRAFHGTRPMEYDEQREAYRRLIIDLADPRYVFLNTLFSLSEASMYCQLVDRLEQGMIPGAVGYADLYRIVKRGTWTPPTWRGRSRPRSSRARRSSWRSIPTWPPPCSTRSTRGRSCSS
jgi:hypothetical protein